MKSVRALFGTDGSKNATHGSDSVQSAEREIQLLFGVTQENNDTQTEAKHPTSADETTSEAAGTAVPANGGKEIMRCYTGAESFVPKTSR